jgi:hypothetical protein
VDAGRGRRRRGSGGDLGEATEQLGTLLQHSLAQRVDTAAEPRFRMLETIREFGLEALGQPMRQRAFDDATSSNHLALSEEAEPHVGRRV